MSNIVAIVGRPNVGKSTLFNRLLRKRQAIVDDVSGVTRDRHYGKAEWIGREFSIIDTGGYTINSEDVFEEEIKRQVELAIDEASLIVFVVDVTTGITDHDQAIAQLLRRANKPVMVVANKVDTNDRILQAGEFYGLGLGDVHCISAANGGGTGDMLDALVRMSGVTEASSRLEVEVVNRPGALAGLLDRVASRHVNVSSVMTSRSDADTVSFVLRVGTAAGHELAAHLRGLGYTVYWPPERA